MDQREFLGTTSRLGKGSNLGLKFYINLIWNMWMVVLNKSKMALRGNLEFIW